MLPSLQPTCVIDSDSELVSSFVDKHIDRDGDVLSAAVSLYYAVRDSFNYNPFLLTTNLFKQPISTLLERSEGHCIDKACFLVACLRNACIPAKMGLAKVKNHMGTSKFEKYLKSDVLVPHGYVSVFSDNKWVKCTPAFDKRICERLEVEPLQWDGKTDSVFQQYDSTGGSFMEYIEDYGAFTDIPSSFIMELIKAHYPHMLSATGEFIPPQSN